MITEKRTGGFERVDEMLRLNGVMIRRVVGAQKFGSVSQDGDPQFRR